MRGSPASQALARLGMELHMQAALVGVETGLPGAGKPGKAFGAGDICLPLLPMACRSQLPSFHPGAPTDGAEPTASQPTGELCWSRDLKDEEEFMCGKEIGEL